jgi:hypothetical protein
MSVIDLKRKNDILCLLTEFDKYAEGVNVPPCEKINTFIDSSSYGGAYWMRQQYILRYGFALPCLELIEAIKALNSPVVSVGCGAGYLDKLLDNAGVNVISTDPKPLSRGLSGYGFLQEYCKIRQYRGTTAVTKYPDRAVFMSWPTWRATWAYETAKAMQKDRYLIYIGEGEQGATATDQFFHLLAHEFVKVKDVAIPQFKYSHDYCTIYLRTGA